MSPPMEALEIGCEGGRWSSLLAGLGWSITCTDVDAEVLARCAARLPEARCVVVEPGDRTLPLADASVSLVLCIEVQPVIQSDWFPREVVRVLRPGGELVGVTWNRLSARGMATDLMSRVRGRGGHGYYGQTYRPWRRRMEAAGLQFISERGMCWFPFGRASDSRLVPAAAWIEDRGRLWKLPSLSPWILFTARSAPRPSS
jgi:SAM-dependent methyltransferase